MKRETSTKPSGFTFKSAQYQYSASAFGTRLHEMEVTKVGRYRVLSCLDLHLLEAILIARMRLVSQKFRD